MEIEFLNLKNKTAKFKATVYATGKLNFSPECKQMENFDKIKFFKVGTGGPNKKNIYLVTSEENEENTIKVHKTSKAHYLQFSEVLEELKIDYKKNSLTFEVTKNENQYHGKDVYILKKIESKKRDARTKNNEQ